MKAIAVTPMSKQISIINMPEPSLSSPTDVKLRMIEAGGAAPIKKSAPSNGTPPPGAADLVNGHESLSEAVEAILYNEPVYRRLDGRDRCRRRACFLDRPSRRHYVVTAPGGIGRVAAFLAEVLITFILMTVILRVSNQPRLYKFTGLCAGLLVAFYITFEAPISGMSLNPARSFASAVPARLVDLGIYFIAPLIGMLSAAEVHLRVGRAPQIGCAKLHHDNSQRCIFCGKPSS